MKTHTWTASEPAKRQSTTALARMLPKHADESLSKSKSEAERHLMLLMYDVCHIGYLVQWQDSRFGRERSRDQFPEHPLIWTGLPAWSQCPLLTIFSVAEYGKLAKDTTSMSESVCRLLPLRPKRHARSSQLRPLPRPELGPRSAWMHWGCFCFALKK